jgi:hypothetical protein
MSGTRRVPLARRSAAMITATALAAFKQLRALEAQCTGPPDCEPLRRCAACDQWWAQQKIIHDELALKPWHYPAVEYEGMGDWPPNEAARALWRAFEEVAREPEPRQGRKRVRRSRTESENPTVVVSDLPSEPVA